LPAAAEIQSARRAATRLVRRIERPIGTWRGSRRCAREVTPLVDARIEQLFRERVSDPRAR
jgi:hypothetical protein